MRVEVKKRWRLPGTSCCDPLGLDLQAAEGRGGGAGEDSAAVAHRKVTPAPAPALLCSSESCPLNLFPSISFPLFSMLKC